MRLSEFSSCQNGPRQARHCVGMTSLSVNQLKVSSQAKRESSEVACVLRGAPRCLTSHLSQLLSLPYQLPLSHAASDHYRELVTPHALGSSGETTWRFRVRPYNGFLLLSISHKSYFRIFQHSFASEALNTIRSVEKTRSVFSAYIMLIVVFHSTATNCRNRRAPLSILDLKWKSEIG